MINAATIMIQIQEWLKADPDLQGFIVERSEPVNEDPGRAVNGWIGLYRKTLDYDPRNLGVAPNNYEADFEFLVFVQRTSLESGASAEDILEATIKTVLDKMVQLPKTHIDHFAEILIDYTYLETDRKTMYFQGALITFTAEVTDEVK